MNKGKATELEYLQWFHENIGDSLGPASDDVIAIMKAQFVAETGKDLPDGY